MNMIIGTTLQNDEMSKLQQNSLQISTFEKQYKLMPTMGTVMTINALFPYLRVMSGCYASLSAAQKTKIQNCRWQRV